MGGIIRCVFGSFDVDVFPVVECCPSDAFSVVETCADAKDFETVADVLYLS